MRNETIREILMQEETLINGIKKRRSTRFSHVSRIDDKRLLARAMHCHVKGSRGRQPKRWIDNVKAGNCMRELDKQSA